jgi:hypothetical protein
LRRPVAAPFLTSRSATKDQTQLITLIVGAATGRICRAVKLLLLHKRKKLCFAENEQQQMVQAKSCEKKHSEELCMLTTEEQYFLALYYLTV